MTELKKHITDTTNGLNYTLYGDYYLPELGVESGYPLGKYGMTRMKYLVQAQHLLDTMIPQMAKDAGVTEQMKMSDHLRWVGMMNAIKGQVEEIIYQEIVYN